MPSSPRTASASLLQLLIVGALTVAVRLPFLLHGARFFDADEAVEGLMARHVLRGEFPAFLWGQHYKGVPEVYLASLFFAAAGPGVVALKSATLTAFVAFVCVQFLLVERLFSNRIAWVATAFAIVGPPSLVLWSLSANAEIAMTLLAGAVMGLELDRWRRTGSLVALAIAGAALGFGFWVQQYIVYYLAALGVAWVASLPRRGERIRELMAARRLPAWGRLALNLILAAALGYLILGLVAFLTAGFDLPILGLTIGLKNPQKLWRIAAGMAAIYGAGRALGWVIQRGPAAGAPAVAALLGLIIGYAPALAGRLHGRGAAPIARMDVFGLRIAIGSIVREVVPIVLGFRSPTTEWLPVSGWLALAIAVALAASYASRWPAEQGPATRFFHVFVGVTPLLFIASGAFIDAQSYRYLMPLYAGLPVVLAVGVDQVGRWLKPAGAVIVILLIGMFAAQEIAWYRLLVPDTDSRAILACLEAGRVRGAFADYWLSYKLTFLADERVIVAPDSGVDRYPPFSTFVRSLTAPGTGPYIVRRPVSIAGAGPQPCSSILVQ